MMRLRTKVLIGIAQFVAGTLPAATIVTVTAFRSRRNPDF
jgi:hypothetical protein